MEYCGFAGPSGRQPLRLYRDEEARRLELFVTFSGRFDTRGWLVVERQRAPRCGRDAGFDDCLFRPALGFCYEPLLSRQIENTCGSHG